MKKDKHFPNLPQLGAFRNHDGGIKGFYFEIAIGETHLNQILKHLYNSSDILRRSILDMNGDSMGVYNSMHRGKVVKVDKNDKVISIKIVVKEEPWQVGGR